MIYPWAKLHLVVDNSGTTYQHLSAQAWLARNPRIATSFTPTLGWWLNLVEIFLATIARRPFGRGTFTWSRPHRRHRAFTDEWNEHCRQFTWNKTPTRHHQSNVRSRTSSTRP